MKTTKGVGKFVASPTIVKVKTIGMGIFKMIKFINWFYKFNKKLYLESKKGHKHQLKDFSDKKFHLKDVKKVKTNYLDIINVKKNNKHDHFGDINVEEFFAQMLNHTDSDEHITFGKLKKRLEKVTPLLIDIKHHIEPEEECIFLIIVESKKKSQRISKYFYHLGGVCYENTALNMGVERKSIEVVKNVRDKDHLKMKAIKYIDDSVSGLGEHVENFNELHDGDVSECQIGNFLETAEKDKYGRFTTTLEEINRAKIESEPEIEIETDSNSSDHSENGSFGDGEISD